MKREEDIAPVLLKKLQEDFKKEFKGNREIAGLYEKVSTGTATYAEAAEFSQRTGEILAEVFGKDIKEELLPNGKMYYNIAQRTVRPMLENNYGLVADICEQVQTAMNKQAGIGIKAMRPKLNDDQIKGIVNRLSSEEEYGKVAWILNAPVKTFSQSVVDDSIKENVDFQGKAGLYPRIERRTAGNCCPWCEEKAGSYRYPNVPKDVYRRHNNCLCSVDYDPGSGLMRGKTQNAHSKNWDSEDERQERIERNQRINDQEEQLNRRKERIELSQRMEEQEQQLKEQKLLVRREIKGLDISNDRDKIENRKLINRGLYYSNADPMADVFGPGIISHPKEVNAFIEECKSLGVQVIERDKEVLAYQPATIVGYPGQIVINRNASYSAWCHEMKHMRDDHENGWDGCRRVWDIDDHYKREKEAYEIEIRLAIEAGREDIADQLRANLEKERRRIYGIQ